LAVSASKTMSQNGLTCLLDIFPSLCIPSRSI
jgi:hypothetical protein